MSADPNATPVVQLPNIQSREDNPIDTNYAPNYSDIVQSIDAERDGQGKASISAITTPGAPMYSPNIPQTPPAELPPQGNGWQPPPPPLNGSQNQQFEYERQTQEPMVGYQQQQLPQQQYSPSPAPEQLEYYTSGDDDIPFHIRYRLPLIAGGVFLVATMYGVPKLAPLIPSAFPNGVPNTTGSFIIAVLITVGFYFVDKTTRTLG